MEYDYPCSPRDIRQLLNRVFDDTNLDTFCLEYSIEVYNKFSRGMRKDEKLNLLLHYYHPSTGRFETLLRVIYEYDHKELKLFCEKNGIRFNAPRSSWTPARSKPSYTAVQPHHFDLDDLVSDCLGYLLDRQGLIGLVIPYNTPVFLNNFCELLKDEWGRHRVYLKKIVKVDPILKPVDDAIQTINRSYFLSLPKRDILFPVQLEEVGQIGKFWHGLQRSVEGRSLPNRLITVLGINKEAGTLPTELVHLELPRFKRAHVYRWVRRVVETFAWPDEMTQHWTNQIIVECSHGNELVIEWVYDHLEAMVELLKQNPPIDHFQQELERRRQFYV